MDIPFPEELQWVSYLAGGAWPRGSETRMGRIGGHFDTARGELLDLLPDLNSVRSETISVLYGDTAMAAVNQFAMLFDGDYSVDTLATGVAALGGGAQDLGVQIEYSKLSIIVGLGLAALEIGWCLANAAPTGGASLSWIPTIEWTTMTSIRRLVTTVLEKITTKLGQMLEQTTIKDLVHHGIREAFQELGQGLAQEGITQGIQVGQGRAHWRADLFRQNAIASAVGGAAGGGTALPVGHALGRAESKLGRATKGMTTMFTAGISGNVAGTTAVGGEFDTLAVIAGSAGSSVGGVKGLGHGVHPDNETNTGRRAEPGTGQLPSGQSPDLDLDEDAAISEPKIDEPSADGSDAESQARQNDHGAGLTSSSASTANNGHVKGVAAQSDSAASSVKRTTDHQPAQDDVEPNAEPSSSRPADDPVDPSTQSSKGTTPSDVQTTSDPQVHHQASTNSVTDEPHSPPTQNGQPPANHVPVHTDQPSVPESRIEPTGDPVSQTATSETPATHAANAAPATPAAPAAGVTAGTPAGTATPSPSAPHPAAPVPHAAAPATAHSPTSSPSAPTPIRPVQENVSASPTKAASTAESKGAPAARVADSVAEGAKPTAKGDAEPTPVARSTRDHGDTPRTNEATDPVAERPSRRDVNCLPKTAENLTARYAEHGREFRVETTVTDEGAPAQALFKAAKSGSEFQTYREIKKRLLRLGPGSSAIVASSWSGSGRHMGGHTYLAVNDGGKIYLLDGDVRSGWPPHWGQRSISRVAVGYLDSTGAAVNSLHDTTVQLAAADAVGHVAGHPEHDGGSHHGDRDPGERWRDVTTQDRLARDALELRGVQSAADLRNPLGQSETSSERARENTKWWRTLNGDQQRALIDEFPEDIGNAEGIPADARHAANTRALDQQRRELQAWRERGERLTRFQRKELARLDRIQHALDRATVLSAEAGFKDPPRLLAFDSGAFGGDGRALVSFGEDPYKADTVAWHVPGQGMTIDQLGPAMGDALNHLQSIRQEDSTVSASTIAWIGYDTPSGPSTWRAAGHKFAREGAEILYSDVRAFNTVRDTLAGDGSHFNANHIFAHSYGSTTASHAGRDGRLANDIRTITLAGSPGAGDLRHASEFGIGADNVYVASSSRDPFTALGGLRPGSMGRIFGRGLGVDPAMHSFGAHRITAEFSAEMDSRGNRGTHNAYYRFVDRGTDPPLRSESLANFGRIASGHADRVDTERHRTVDRQPRRLFGTREGRVEPAAHRPLRLEGDNGEHAGDRETRRAWNPHWLPFVDPAHVADAALAERGIRADDLMSPVDHRVPPAEAVALAEANGHWWRGLSETQQRALIETYPHQIGNAEGIPPLARHDANSIRLQQDLARRDFLVDKRASGIALTENEEKFIDLMNKIDDAMRMAERNARQAGVGGPYLLAFDPDAFDGVGRAMVSFGDDPYKAGRVLWYVPGMSTNISKLHTMMLRGFNTLQSTLQENPDLSVASITYIGYKPPGSWDREVASPQMARDGGQIFASDLLSFNAGRDVFADDGSHFSGNHVFAHSYGSTTVSYAGHDGRLANDVRTITLIGSPGAGDLRHASEFGIGDNVFVASSSRDFTTALGGERPGVRGRIRDGMGLGVDPAMDSFGAHRVTAEFPTALDQLQGTSRMTHSLYWAYMDPGANPHIRSESLANFGRIAAGHIDRVDTEHNRYLDEFSRRVRGGTVERTVDPAIGRDLRLPDDPDGHHPTGRRHWWNPRFRRLPHGAVPDRPLAESRHASESRHDDAGQVPHVPNADQTLADDALRDRGIAAKDLMSPVDHRVPKRQAVALARENGRWWKSLSPDEQKALIKTYPHEIGNAEGIPPLDRQKANSIMLDRHRAHRDVLVSRSENGVALNGAEKRFVDLMKQIDDAMRTAEANARKARVGGPYLLALDPRAFNGAGRAIVSLGENPYTAKRVLWYVPGMTTTIEKLHPMMQRAFNQLQSALQVDPNLSVASITYIGYRAPGSWDPNVIFQRLARNGGNIFASDISSFNAGRDVFTGEGHFRGNHIFAHSYGSSTVSHAGQNGQLANEVQTITLIGSPGAGPVRHASQFGIGDNVYVAASTRDKTPGLGGDRAGERGRAVRKMGQGMDPAMKAFGARRITAEFPAELDHSGPGSRMTHSLYWAYHDPGQHHVRSESLTNFGRIAAGHDVDEEGHRYLERRRGWFGTRERTVDPAIGRRLRIEDDPDTPRSVHGRNIWNPKFSRDNNCGPAAVDALSARHPEQDFRPVADRSPKGVDAFRLFKAIRSASTFATYQEIGDELRKLGPGSSALVASRWRGWRAGGHAYLAINDGGEIYLLDTHTGERSGWPPHWGQDAVKRTAVGYLRPNGEAVHKLDGSRGQLDEAHAIRRVQGLRGDPDFTRRQEEYRAQDLADRHVDTRYAEPLADIVDSADDRAAARRLADDLSGVYGPYRIRYGEVFRFGTEVQLSGDIYHGDTKIGRSAWIIDRAADGHLVVTNSGLVIDAEFKNLRGQGFSRTLTSELERYFVRSGVDRIELHTHDKGGYAWPRMDYNTWNPEPRQLQESLDQVKASASRLREVVGPQAQAVLDDIVQRLDPNHPRLPEPTDLVNLATDDEPELGRRLMEGASNLNRGLNLVRYLPHDLTSEATSQSHTGFGARLKRLFGLGDSRSTPDCAYVAADELSTMYADHGRTFRVVTGRSRMGTPAWALFEAVGARAEFADYNTISEGLHQLGPGSSAVITSRWAGGRSGGHAYLAVYDGNEVHLFDPETRQRSGWPPHWGQDAVGRTAVGYLDGTGAAVNPLTDAPLQRQLAHADAVGDVRGHPVDPDFVREQADYRGQDLTTRAVNSRYAEALGDIVDNAADRDRVRQLAKDLSGVFGPYRVEMFRAEVSSAGEVIVGGYILNGDEEVGFMQRTFFRDADGKLVAHHDVVEINELRFKFKGFSRALAAQLDPLYERSGVDRIELRTEQDGGDVWARRGFTWNTDPQKLQDSLQSVTDSAQNLLNWVSDDAKAVLRETVARLDPSHPRLPEPIELASLATPDEPDLGRQLMYGTMWHGVKHLQGGPAGDATALSHSGSGTAVDQVAELHGTNCAHLVAHVLWEMYGIEINLDAPATAAGVPARALFEAVGSRARFATYDEVGHELRELGPGSSAILVSRWSGGRQGGHAYLAVNVGGDIFLVESHSGRQLGWPPYWGEDAVARTAVGYLDADGVPTHQLTPDVPLRLQLADADAIGDVQGLPEDGDADVPSDDVPFQLGATEDQLPGPVRELGLPSYPPGTLTDAETTTVYGHGEHRMRELNEHLQREGVSAEDRARILSEHRNSLRAWTRDLMSNRTTAEFLAANETNPTFEELLARNEARGLTGDVAYEAIIHTATRSAHSPGALSDVETTAVYSDFELRLRELNEQLVRDGVSAEDRARMLSDLRSSLRAWTRELMSNRAAADWLATNESNPSFADLVARNEAKGLVGDEVNEAIVDSATHSHYAAETLSNAETRTVYTTLELRMREVSEQLDRDGVGLEERAKTLYGLRASIRTWTRSLMADRETAEYLTANEPNPTFDDLVERQRAKGREGDAIYEAIIASATRSRPSVNESLGIDPDNPPPLPPMRGPTNND
jgi:hypothetical protein